MKNTYVIVLHDEFGNLWEDSCWEDETTANEKFDDTIIDIEEELPCFNVDYLMDYCGYTKEEIEEEYENANLVDDIKLIKRNGEKEEILRHEIRKKRRRCFEEG